MLKHSKCLILCCIFVINIYLQKFPTDPKNIELSSFNSQFLRKILSELPLFAFRQLKPKPTLWSLKILFYLLERVPFLRNYWHFCKYIALPIMQYYQEKYSIFLLVEACQWSSSKLIKHYLVLTQICRTSLSLKLWIHLSWYWGSRIRAHYFKKLFFQYWTKGLMFFFCP